MMTTLWLIRYSEIFLKSDPVRRHWENLLMTNIRRVLPDCHVNHERGRIWLSGEVDPERLSKVFGIVSFSKVEKAALSDLNVGLLAFCRKIELGSRKTFAMRVKRIGDHPFSSQKMAADTGSIVLEEYPHLTVDLRNPDKEIFIEIRDDRCYLYDTIIEGPGGIPLGAEGTLVALVSGGIDSPVAAWMMMKRGCRIIPIYVSLDEFLDETIHDRAEKVIESLRPYQPDINLQVITDQYLASAKKELIQAGLEKYTCIFCKRRMYRIAESVARSCGAAGVVTGESLGQVASQTLDNLIVLNDAATIPIHRPLIGFDKEEIIRLAQKIGTFVPSITRTTGCQAVPKGPSTKADLEKILDIEGKLTASKMPLPKIHRPE